MPYSQYQYALKGEEDLHSELVAVLEPSASVLEPELELEPYWDLRISTPTP